MNMAFLLAGFAVFVALFCGFTAWRWRGGYIPIHWVFFVMMMMGALAVAIYYVDVGIADYMGLPAPHRMISKILVSRAIFGFILTSTVLMCIGANTARKK